MIKLHEHILLIHGERRLYAIVLEYALKHSARIRRGDEPILLFMCYNVNILFLRTDDKVRAAHVIDSLLR